MDFDELYPSKYVKASDLNGKEATLLIDSVEREIVGRDGDKKVVMGFRGKDKRLVLNKTNGHTISRLYGKRTENWVGKAITLFPTVTEYGGQQVSCVRVKEPPSPPQHGTADFNDDVPFDL
jgi:hypothetical protein